MENRHYWGFRISNDLADYFMSELHNGRLRQGWGYDAGQDLCNMTVDEGASRNLRMLKVSKGDILLVPHLPEHDKVAIVQATEDWNKGYRFDIDKKYGDFGHIFPARYLHSFTRRNEHVSANIRSTLRNPGRFWNIDYCSKEIDGLVNRPQSDLQKVQDLSDRFQSSIESVYDEFLNKDAIKKRLVERLNQQFGATEWEYALVDGLKLIYPEPYFIVERVGGITEVQHGTDIIIRIPSLIESYEYIIAIQVKDYEGFVSEDVIAQIRKADSYFNNENQKLIEKLVLVTRASKDNNEKLLQCGDVKFLFAEDMESLLDRIGRILVGNTMFK